MIERTAKKILGLSAWPVCIRIEYASTHSRLEVINDTKEIWTFMQENYGHEAEIIPGNDWFFRGEESHAIELYLKNDLATDEVIAHIIMVWG